MHRTKFERLKDDLIGEAVLSILKENGPITFCVSLLIVCGRRLTLNQMMNVKYIDCR